MSQEKMIELQHQVRQNNEELHDFLRDLGAWTKQMEQKDEQLKNKKASREINKPQNERLRSVDELKRKNPENGQKIDNLNEVEKKSKVDSASNASKKINSYDYEAWSKFDVEKALDEIEDSQENQNADKDGEITELTSEMLLQKAVVEKEKGNQYFKVFTIASILILKSLLPRSEYVGINFQSTTLLTFRLENINKRLIVTRMV